ncbi:MAG: hypothetical protein H6936_08680 [Burkholderiales bacterium]|nr:hypothetical protein [Nitrosomonas sp.]MCP5274907.1 hypothetical protein [Burkholderiales bacterium]
MENFRNNVTIIVGLAIIIIGGLNYLFNQPPSVEYLKEHPEEFRFEKFENINELDCTLRELLPVGIPKEEVNNLLIDTAGAFKTLEYYEDKEKKWQARQEDKEYQIVYFAADKIAEDSFPWISTGWEIWVRFTPKNKLKSYEVKRIDYMASFIQKLYLSENPENLERKTK